LGTLADSLEQLGATATVLVLVGPALSAMQTPARSHVYSATYAHTFRSVPGEMSGDDR
jgi:precorrin-4 methylase